jgi:predicted mannosyl-3-phosphoglycerate phosphatase (HAD superfamily)
MLASFPPLPSPQPPSADVVIIADVDGILRHVDLHTPAEARPLFAVLANSPLVLCSTRGATELRDLQRELGICHPFISDGGAALHIPTGYFCGASADEDGCAMETIDFGVRRLGHAVRLLVALYRTRASAPLIVGIGYDWRDRVLLREVDVPIVLRDPTVDQTALVRNLPGAYVTEASGGDGVIEVLLGHGSVGRS